MVKNNCICDYCGKEFLLTDENSIEIDGGKIFKERISGTSYRNKHKSKTGK